MSILIKIFFILFAIINVYLIFNILSLRNLLKILFAKEDKIKNRDLKILYRLSEHNPLVREYIVYNAPIFIYPFAAITISSIGSLMQIFSVLIFIFSIFKFNLVFLTLSVIFFFLSGYTGSRFNKKAMFNEAVKNFTQKIPPHDGIYFHQMLSYFHERYYQEIKHYSDRQRKT